MLCLIIYKVSSLGIWVYIVFLIVLINNYKILKLFKERNKGEKIDCLL